MLPVLGTILATATAPGDVLSLTAVAAFAVLAVLAVLALRRAAAVSGTTRGPLTAAAGSTGERHAVSRNFDPDAAGRPRPRAPSAGPAA